MAMLKKAAATIGALACLYFNGYNPGSNANEKDGMGFSNGNLERIVSQRREVVEGNIGLKLEEGRLYFPSAGLDEILSTDIFGGGLESFGEGLKYIQLLKPSPDNSTFAFRASNDIFLVERETGDYKLLGNIDVTGYSDLEWSSLPGVAYISDYGGFNSKGGGIWKLDGKSLELIYQDEGRYAHQLALSPDEKKLAFVEHSYGYAAEWKALDLSTGEARTVLKGRTRYHDEEVLVDWFNQAYLIVEVEKDEFSNKLTLVNTATGGLSNLKMDGYVNYHRFSISEDRQWIAASSVGMQNFFDIYRVSGWGLAMRVDKGLVFNDLGASVFSNYYSMSWSPDNKLAAIAISGISLPNGRENKGSAFLHYLIDPAIRKSASWIGPLTSFSVSSEPLYLGDADGDNPLLRKEEEIGEPFVLLGKDGVMLEKDRVYFIRMGDIFSYNLYSMSEEGYDLRVEGSEFAYRDNLSLSPDAKAIAYEKDNREIWISDLESGLVRKVFNIDIGAPDHTVDKVEWGKDNRKIFLSDMNGHVPDHDEFIEKGIGHIWVVEGDRVEKLPYTGIGYNHQLALSPDEKRLAYIEHVWNPDARGRYSLILHDLVTNRRSALISADDRTYYNNMVEWVDENVLLHDDGSGQIIRFDFAKGRTQRIDLEGKRYSLFSLSPDGNYLLGLREGALRSAEIYETGGMELIFDAVAETERNDFSRGRTERPLMIDWMGPDMPYSIRATIYKPEDGSDYQYGMMIWKFDIGSKEMERTDLGRGGLGIPASLAISNFIYLPKGSGIGDFMRYDLSR